MHLSRTGRLLVVLALNLAMVAGLIAAGLAARSLAVFAEGGDYLLDAAGIGVAVTAAGLAARHASAGRRHASDRVTALAALVNAGWLLILELLVAAAAIDRLAHRAPTVAGLPVLVVSGIAALVMAAGALILKGDDSDGDGDRDLSVMAVLLDTAADATAAAAVAVSGAIILAVHGWYWLDPAVALGVALVFSYQAGKLSLKAARRLARSAAARSATREEALTSAPPQSSR